MKTPLLLAVLVLVSSAGAEEPYVVWQSPPAPQADAAPRRVAFREEPRKRAATAGARDTFTAAPAQSGGGAGPLTGLRAVSLKEGEARVALGGSERVLRLGDAIGTDVVKSIEPGRMVLARTTPEFGEALVIVTFDAQGRAARVRVFSTRDPITRVVPEVK